MPINSAPLNTNEPMVDERRRPSKSFLQWVTSLVTTVDKAPSRVNTIELAGQGASITTTAIGSPAAEGLYRVAVYQRITTAAAVSSSLTTAIGWTHGGVACSTSGAALTGNTTATTGTFSLLLRSDAASPLTFATTYASNAAGVMKYSLDITLESVAA